MKNDTAIKVGRELVLRTWIEKKAEFHHALAIYWMSSFSQAHYDICN